MPPVDISISIKCAIRIIIRAGKNKILNRNNPNDLKTIRNMILCDSEDDEDIVLDENDTDEEEHILKRQDMSQTECSKQNRR
ncbi:hypothetical protein NPIL_389611 [Nephila pilipes]|uniref:Uncharacterized protein n=1 Tax=Nephila pilipes TaxID=299642 RepID=A0A8X6IDR6_NEPPI|nr:hypothetical protein NPIL_389611 [Nephila pilipes]